MNVDDVYLVLYYYWAQDTIIYPNRRQRLQVSFLMLISAYTATRPGALVYVERNVKERRSCPIRDEDRDSSIEKDKGIELDEISDDENIELIYKDKDDNIGIDSKSENNERDRAVEASLGHLDRRESLKTICYEDVRLLVLPNLTRPRDLLALEVDLRYTKGHQRQAKR